MQSLTHAWRTHGGHITFVTCTAGAAAAFLMDTWTRSTDIQNLLLIVPMVALVVGLYAAIILQLLFGSSADGTEPGGPGRADIRILASMALLGIFVFTMNIVGFDAATFFYVAANILLLGERRPAVVLLFPAAFSGFFVWGMKTIMPYPFQTLLF